MASLAGAVLLVGAGAILFGGHQSLESVLGSG